ncbi:hypothetical protein E2C01_091262 [Portunus trituberculatus]|uniref:Uncharacterized protein n=1 Tax=Portunus trituberculatus TaxID=210409 RepID=A0A5B7JNX3_PORTR|nr:hypothetical protein [Portunus trituberculatus]
MTSCQLLKIVASPHPENEEVPSHTTAETLASPHHTTPHHAPLLPTTRCGIKLQTHLKIPHFKPYPRVV